MPHRNDCFHIDWDDRIAIVGNNANDPLPFPEFLTRLNRTAEVLEKSPGLEWIVLRDRGPGRFFNVDLQQPVHHWTARTDVESAAKQLQAVLARWAALPCPTMAVLDGPIQALSTELAYACRFRTGVIRPDNHLQFVDPVSGLAPFGGTLFRLCYLVGRHAAERHYGASGPISMGLAVRHGLIDSAVCPTRLESGIRTEIERRRSGPTERPARSVAVWRRNLARFLEGRWPAPSETKHPVEKLFASDWATAVEADQWERSLFADQVVSLETKCAVAVADLPEPPSRTEFSAVPRREMPGRIGIVGSGRHGMDWAIRLTERGFAVVVRSVDAVRSVEAERRFQLELQASMEAGRITADTAEKCRRFARWSAEWDGFADCDWVIEAIDEDLESKQAVLEELESRVRPRTVLAVTSTTIAVELLQHNRHRPQRLLGLHLPPYDGSAICGPVEIIPGPLTDPMVLQDMTEWCGRLGLRPIAAADRPGRLIETLRMHYLHEAVHLVAEGLSPKGIDEACRRFGMKLLPLQYCDQTGFKNLAARVTDLQSARGDDFGRILQLDRAIRHGVTGADSEGFYRRGWRGLRSNETLRMILWRDLDDDAQAQYVFDPVEAIREGWERIMLRTINESAACLMDEPDADAAVIDFAAVHGMGWNPRTGGPLRHADTLGLPYVIDRLAGFSERYGPRFEPCAELLRRAEAGEGFYDTAPARVIELRIPASQRKAG